MILYILCIAGYIDYKSRIIPTGLIITMYFMAVFISNATVLERVSGFLIPAFPLFFVALRYKDLKGGDIKYLSVVGAYFGLTKLAIILVPTVLAAIVWSIVKKERSVPLALMIAIGTALVMIGGLLA